MTINYSLDEIEVELKLFGKQKVRLDWVSHGNYSISHAGGKYTSILDTECEVPKFYIPLEPEHFDAIIDAFHKFTNLKDVFDNMWQGVVPPRGMHCWPTLVRTFRDHEWLTIHQQTFWGKEPSHLIESVTMKIEGFVAIRDTVKANGKPRPYHCMTIG